MRVPRPETPCWHNGQRLAVSEAAVPLADPALLSGRGLFETFGTEAGRVLDLPEHLERLERGGGVLALQLPSPSALRETLISAAREIAAPRGWLKLVICGEGRWFVFGEACVTEQSDRAVRAVLLPWRRSVADPLDAVKSLNYARNTLGLELARERGADEGIWLNTRGHLAEACTANLFLVHGGRLHTPGEGEGILAGVVRGRVLEAARSMGMQPAVGKVRLRRLEQASEAFLTSSVRGVRPLVLYEDRPVGRGEPGPLTARLAAAVAEVRTNQAAT